MTPDCKDFCTQRFGNSFHHLQIICIAVPARLISFIMIPIWPMFRYHWSITITVHWSHYQHSLLQHQTLKSSQQEHSEDIYMLRWSWCSLFLHLKNDSQILGNFFQYCIYQCCLCISLKNQEYDREMLHLMKFVSLGLRHESKAYRQFAGKRVYLHTSNSNQLDPCASEQIIFLLLYNFCTHVLKVILG